MVKVTGSSNQRTGGAKLPDRPLQKLPKPKSSIPIQAKSPPDDPILNRLRSTKPPRDGALCFRQRQQMWPAFTPPSWPEITPPLTHDDLRNACKTVRFTEYGLRRSQHIPNLVLDMIASLKKWSLNYWIAICLAAYAAQPAMPAEHISTNHRDNSQQHETPAAPKNESVRETLSRTLEQVRGAE